MFVFSVKASKMRLVTMAFCAVVLVVLVLAVTARSSSTAATGASTMGTTVPGGSETARVALLRSLGYRVELPVAAVEEILIPDVFDEETTRYNQLQQTAGMDLQPYHGKRLKCWTYTLQGDVSGEDTVAHLYEYKDTIVAGHVSATRADGFMRALTRATTPSTKG